MSHRPRLHLVARTLYFRHERGRRNLVELYLPLCDTWIGYDNSSEVPQLIAEGGINQETVIYNQEIINQILGE